MIHKIKSINLAITNRCNLKCTMCDIWKERPMDLSISAVKRLLKSRALDKDVDIAITGGEPFLRDDLNEIVDIIEKEIPGGFRTITTNGLLTEKILRFVRQNRHLDFKLNISLDGIEGIHDEIRGVDGAFSRTVNTINHVKKLFPSQKIELKLTLLPKNYNQIFKVYRLASKLGCDFSFKPAENMKNYTNKIGNLNLNFTKMQLYVIRNQSFKLADVMYEKGDYAKSRFFQDISFYLANKKKPSSCSVLWEHLTVMPNGDCFFCIKEPRVGNILTGDIGKMKNVGLNFKCKACMLMCGSYKDYPRTFFSKRAAKIDTGARSMDFNKFKRLVKDNDITHVSFVGREPLINKDFFKITDHLDKEGITYEITTNEELTGLVNKLRDCIGLKRINFSLGDIGDFSNNESGKKISLMIEPTNRCNMRCPTCFSHQDGRKKRDMSFDEFKKIIDENIDVIRDLSLYNFGEPLLNKDIWRMVRYAKKSGIKYIKLDTNGMQLSRENIASLLDSGLDYLSISLDGATPKTYSKFRIGGDFNLVVSDIKNLVEQRKETKSEMKIAIQFIIMEHNKHEIKRIEELAKGLGVDFLRLKKVLIRKEKWKKFLPRDKEYNRYNGMVEARTCFKPLNELVINSDGTVIPCCYIVGKDVGRFNFGNIFYKSLEDILRSDKYRQFIENCIHKKDKNSCCIGCNEGNLKLDYRTIDLTDTTSALF